MRGWGWSLLCLTVLGCGQTVTEGNGAPFFADGVWSYHGNSAAFLPAVRIAGTWHGAGRDGACTTSDTQISCPAGGGHTVAVAIDDKSTSGMTLTPSVTLAAAVTVEAIGLEGDLTLPGARAWVSNGFQSWSQSGVLAIVAEPSESDTEAALASFGDAETIRDGAALSWWYTAIGGGTGTCVAGVLKPKTQKAWAQVWSAGSPDRVRVRLASGGTTSGAPSTAAGEVVGETWTLTLGSESDALAGFATAFGIGQRPAPMLGWNSWYELWDSTDEKSARANFALAKTALAPITAPAGNWLVIDDSWQKAWGDWTPNSKFPSGIDGLAKDVKAQGWHFGVWMAPFLVSDKLDLVKQHPDWFLPGVSYLHLKNGSMKILDVTNPAAAAHLKGVIEQLATWGCEILKIDFLFAGLYEAPRFDGKSTPIQSYRAALQIIREVADKHGMRLVAVGAPPVPTLEYCDGWRSGTDIAVENFGPAWAFLPNQLRDFAARIPYCQVIACDVDPPILRAPLPASEVDFGLWTVAFAAGGYFLSDNLEVLPTDRLAPGLDAKRLNLALGGKLSLPTSIFPDNPPTTLSSAILDQIALTTTQIVPPIWNTPDGQRVLMNASDVTATIDGHVVQPHSALAP